jgi:hypothetical protein
MRPFLPGGFLNAILPKLHIIVPERIPLIGPNRKRNNDTTQNQPIYGFSSHLHLHFEPALIASRPVPGFWTPKIFAFNLSIPLTVNRLKRIKGPTAGR